MPDSRWGHRSNAGNVGLGIVLLALDVLFLLQQVTGFDVWHRSWPLIVVGCGLLPFLLMLGGGKSASGLAIPASMVTMVGLILLVQNSFNLWQTWAYAWALVAPTSVGIGTWLMGWWADDPERRRSGERLSEIGVVLFLAFAAFFELALNLSGFWRQGLGGTAFALVLMLVGAYLLLRRGDGSVGSWH
jgi:hypothetical protein